MLAMFAAAYLTVQAPATFEDLELAKLNEQKGATYFQTKTNLLVDDGQGWKEDLTVDTTLSDVKYVGSEGGNKDSSHGNSTGAVSWIVTSQNRVFPTIGAKLRDIPHGIQTFLNSQQLMLNFSAGAQIQFGSNPQFVLQKISTVQEDGQTLRKAVATANLKRGTATITQWFQPDKWIVKRFSIDVKGEEKPFSCKGQVAFMD